MLCRPISLPHDENPCTVAIRAGLVVGPALLDVIPFVEAFRLLGRLGVMILVIESGLAVDVASIRRFGLRASLAAATGVILPTLISFALYAGALRSGWKVIQSLRTSISLFVRPSFVSFTLILPVVPQDIENPLTSSPRLYVLSRELLCLF